MTKKYNLLDESACIPDDFDCYQFFPADPDAKVDSSSQYKQNQLYATTDITPLSCNMALKLDKYVIDKDKVKTVDDVVRLLNATYVAFYGKHAIVGIEDLVKKVEE